MFLFKNNKSKEIIFFFLGVIFIFIFCFSFNKVFLPMDMLNYLPSFNDHLWKRPNNFLLADPLFQFEPWRHYAKETIHSFRFPLWNFLSGAGEPFFANPQTAVLFPLQIFYYLFDFKTGINLIILLKLYLFCWFVYLYLKSIGISSKISFVGGVLSTSCSFMIVWIQWPHTNVFLFFPLLLYLTEKLRQKLKLSTKIFISLFYFFAILGGHPETLFHITLFHLLYSSIRLWKDKGKLKNLFLFTFVGFLLGAVQLIPFIEYLINSYAWQSRIWNEQNFLPIYSFIVNIIPFISGAPHLQMYRPLFGINFQELIGGYVGPIILFFVFLNILYVLKNSLFRLWFAIVILSWGIAYKIWPFWLITYMPFMRNAANTRVLGIAGFGLIILFVIIFEEIIKKRIKLSNKMCTLIFVAGLISLGIFIVEQIFESKFINIIKDYSLQKFFPFLLSHILFQLMTSLIFFISLLGFQKKIVSENIFILISVLCIVLQSSFLFVSYNTLSPGYYPKNSFVNALKMIPYGKSIEVGNLSLPSEMNLIYDIHFASGNDALLPANYKKTFDGAFPDKNHWGLPDRINLSSLNKLHISYVISDYNINLEKQDIELNHKTLLPVTKNQFLQLPFTPTFENLNQIRFITANFNRLNTCKVQVSILDGKNLLTKISINAQDIRDNIFYTLNTGNITLKKGKEHYLKISTNDGTRSNCVAFRGSNTSPFVQLLFNRGRNLPLLYKSNNVYVWDVSKEMTHHSILTSKNHEIVSYNSQKHITLDMLYYPGWTVYIDGREIAATNDNSFIGVTIPPGNHILSVEYMPVSFFTGLIISILTLMGIFVYIVRKKRKWILLRKKIWDKKIKITHITMSELFLVTLASLISGITIFIIVILFLLPHSIPLPKTTAINWLTRHHHSMTLDYLRFALYIAIIPLSVIIGWVTYIWKKNR